MWVWVGNSLISDFQTDPNPVLNHYRFHNHHWHIYIAASDIFPMMTITSTMALHSRSRGEGSSVQA